MCECEFDKRKQSMNNRLTRGFPIMHYEEWLIGFVCEYHSTCICICTDIRTCNAYVCDTEYGRMKSSVRDTPRMLNLTTYF